MRNRLSYYSVFLLVGLALISAMLLVVNPFSGAPASATPPATGTAATASSVITSHTSASTQPSQPAGGSGTVHREGAFGGSHDRDGGGGNGSSSVSTSTTTTTTAAPFAQTVDN